MIIKNWMKKDPITISSDMLASEALSLFEEHAISLLAVVDEGKLRGILTRRDLREAASFVTATQSVHELNFFNTRLKVKDLMVRKPITLSVNDTVEKALTAGAKFGRSFFPVLDGEQLVGIVSDRDISRSFYQILGVNEKLCGITLEDDRLEGRAIKEIVVTLDAAGASLHSLFTLKEPVTGKKRLLLRLKSQNVQKLVTTLKEKGYQIVELVEET